MKNPTNNQVLNNEASLVQMLGNNRALRTAAARNSHYLFFHMYFPHYITFPTADFHRQIFTITEDESSKLDVIVAFRGSGKSSIVSLSYILWSILGKQQKHFVLIVSQTQDQAQRLLGHIKYELENNELLINDFGSLGIGSNEWGKDALTLNNNQAKIVVASIEQSIRGLRYAQHRPDVIVIDDIEDSNSVRTREGRNKTYNSFKSEVILVGNDHTRIIMVGNLLHEDSVVARLGEDISLGKQLGKYHEFPLVKNRQSLWPGRFPNPESIEKLRKTINNEPTFKREFLLQLVPSIDQIIHHSWILHYSHIPDKEDSDTEFRGTFIGIDPAISENQTADCTAIVAADVFGSGEKLRIYIHPHPLNKRMNFYKQRAEIKVLYEALGKPTTYIEEVAAQKYLIEQLQNEGFYNVEGVKPLGDKHSRLNLVSPFIKNGQILFPENGCEELISQLTGFGIERHDDLADAFSMLTLKIIEEYRAEPPRFIRPSYTPEHLRPVTAGFLNKVW